MNRDDTIRMAREACGEPAWSGGVEWTWEELERFAALVAAAEREACAVIADTPITGEQDDITMEAKDRIAAAIRSRGKQ